MARHGSPVWFRDQIIKELSRVEAIGRRPSRIFEDWVALVWANLRELPGHMQAAAAGEQHEDSPETQELYERMRSIYKPWCFEHFANAQGHLFHSVEISYADVIGLTYMEWGWPSKGAGQFFTPMPAAQMMARVTLNGRDEVGERLQEAIAKSPLATAALLTGYTVPQEQAQAWWIARVIPAALEHYEPVTISDPTCGSGVMFLAAASILPWWQTQLGLVQFYGMDIDNLCVQMCRINLSLYGLNGRYAPYIVAQMEHQLQTAGANPDNPSGPVPADEEGAEDVPPPPVLEEAEGWDPADYVQVSLFDGEKKVEEPRPEYAAAEIND